MRQTNPTAPIISPRVHRIDRTRRLLLRPQLGTPDTAPFEILPRSAFRSFRAFPGRPTGRRNVGSIVRDGFKGEYNRFR